jgi:sigma-B regulation protein RsbU (phosphoserine phosphatase)
LVEIEKCLERAGFRVDQVPPESDPVKVILEKIEDFNPGVVVVQAGCSGFDTFELCRQLKADPRLKPVPHIIFGCENHARNSVKAFRAGAEYYVALAGEDCLGLVRLVEKLTGKRPGMA